MSINKLSMLFNWKRSSKPTSNESISGKENRPTRFLPNVKDDPKKSEYPIHNRVGVFDNLRHPAARFTAGSALSTQQFCLFAKQLYSAIDISSEVLGTANMGALSQNQIVLPQSGNGKRFLFINADRTLLCRVFNSENSDFDFKLKERTYYFKLRDSCLEFLEACSEMFDVYIFSSGTARYCEGVINALNNGRQLIKGYLSKKNCVSVDGIEHMKPLQIVSNRSMKDIILVDAVCRSLILQPYNSIPIAPFFGNKTDTVLVKLLELLKDISKSEDVRFDLKRKLKIESCLLYSEQQFTNPQFFVSDIAEQQLRVQQK